MRGFKKNIAEWHRIFSSHLNFLCAPKRSALFITTLLYFSPLFCSGAGGEPPTHRTTLDSLLKLNASYTTADNKKLLLLNNIAEKYTWVQIDTALIYSNEAIALAEKLNNKTELVNACNNKATSLSHLLLLEEEEKLLQTALEISKATNNKNGIAETNLILSMNKKGDERKKLIGEALLLFTQTGNKNGLGKAWFYAGNNIMYQNADSALKCYNKAIDLFKPEGNDACIGNAINNLSFSYMLLNDLDRSLSFANLLLETSIAQGNTLNTINGYLSIANYYYIKSDYPKTISNNLKALSLAEQMKSIWSQAAMSGNIGSVYQVIKDYDRALFYLTRARDASKAVPENLIFSLSSIGEIYQLQGMYDSAQVYLEDALAIAIKIDNQVRLVDCYRPLAQLSISTKDFTKAFDYLNLLINCDNKEAVAIAKHYYYYLHALAVKNAPDSILVKNKINPAERKSIALSNLLESYNLFKGQPSEFENKDILLELSRTYEEQGNTAKAFLHFKEYVNVTDSIAKTDNINTIARLQIQYDTEKQEQQIALLTKGKALHQTEIQKQKTQRNGLAGGCALVLLLAGITYNRYRVKQKANSEIEKTMQHLHDTQEKLIEREKLAHLGKLTADVAKELNTPVMRIKNLNTTNRKLLALVTNKHTNEQNVRELKNNLQEINTLGFDADKIVKRVLKESREAAK